MTFNLVFTLYLTVLPRFQMEKSIFHCLARAGTITAAFAYLSIRFQIVPFNRSRVATVLVVGKIFEDKIMLVNDALVIASFKWPEIEVIFWTHLFKRVSSHSHKDFSNRSRLPGFGWTKRKQLPTKCHTSDRQQVLSNCVTNCSWWTANSSKPSRQAPWYRGWADKSLNIERAYDFKCGAKIFNTCRIPQRFKSTQSFPLLDSKCELAFMIGTLGSSLSV